MSLLYLKNGPNPSILLKNIELGGQLLLMTLTVSTLMALFVCIEFLKHFVTEIGPTFQTLISNHALI